MKQEQVLEKVYEPRRLREAWQQVRKNAGAAGVDKMSVDDFEGREEELLTLIHEKLKAGTYRIKPARRIFIPKEKGSSKKRPIDIGVVMDRVASQSINSVFSEIFEPEFTESNFGFRKGKSQHQAIRHVQEAVAEGYEWCVSIDLENFFGEILHNLIFKLVRRKIADEKLVTMIARILKAGAIIDGKFKKTLKGCPQGSPLSPMLSNIVLNELDQELERRGLRYSRWADDFVILVKSERAAHRVMGSVIKYLREKLGLKVNEKKSKVSKINRMTFVGFGIMRGKLRVSGKARKKFKRRVKELTHRNNPLSMYQIIQELNEYLEGWVGYFRIHEFKYLFRDLDGWIRSRLRSMQLKKWKKPKKFQRMMIRAGFERNKARRTWVRMSKWQSVMRKEVRFVMNLEWFRKQGIVFLNDYATLKANA